MNIYLLRIVATTATGELGGMLFEPWNHADAHVIVAATEQQARETATLHDGKTWWLSDDLCSCEQVDLMGGARVILSSDP